MKCMKKLVFLFIVSILLMSSCAISPEPIVYGSDGCHFCSMTIVDQQHAAQFVTKKGKSFKFDATECMMNQLRAIDNNTIALFLVTDYENPGALIDATTATYLISENIPSPMGAYLSAFKSKEVAENVKNENQGELYTWESLKEKFKKKK